MAAGELPLRAMPLPTGLPSGHEADRVFIHDLVVDASIGLYDDEMLQTQPVQLSIDMDLLPLQEQATKETIVCYDTLSSQIEAMIAEGHIDLVETLAERIAELCLARSRVFRVTVSVAKPEAVKTAAAVGARITRSK